MTVHFDSIKIGSEWTRPELAKLWGYNGYEAISRGIITPAEDNKLILFITEEKQSGFTKYKDSLVNNILTIEGEKNHAADERLISAEKVDDQIHLFFRKRHHSP